jgi:predicted flap endonuclease-1-like 5' DNA nuclease
LHDVTGPGGSDGQDLGDQGQVQGEGGSNRAGCDAQTDEATRQELCGAAVGATDLPLTLSAVMRVSLPDEAATDWPGGETANERAVMAAVSEGSQSLLAPDQSGMEADLASGQDRLVAALQQARPTGPRDDLSSLPGAGPGLIWMLQKCGIVSLQDLAGADPAMLVPRLGLVGKIVNVQSWQRYAQRQVAQLS